MKTTQGLRLNITGHAYQTMIEKGFSEETVREIFRSGKITKSGNHPGQYRVSNGKVVIVGKPEGKKFVMITAYLDGVVTEVRPDQLLTAKGRKFAVKGRAGKR